MAEGFTLRIRPEAIRAIGEATDDVVEKLGLQVEANAVRIVPVGKSKGKHKGGTLKRSITHEVVRDADGRLSMLIGAKASYGRFVEKGTSRMKAQPYLVPALYQARLPG